MIAGSEDYFWFIFRSKNCIFQRYFSLINNPHKKEMMEGKNILVLTIKTKSKLYKNFISFQRKKEIKSIKETDYEFHKEIKNIQKWEKYSRNLNEHMLYVFTFSCFLLLFLACIILIKFILWYKYCFYLCSLFCEWHHHLTSFLILHLANITLSFSIIIKKSERD